MSKLRVWMYHKISEDRKDFLTVRQSDFIRQLDFISSRYQVIRLSDLNNYLLGQSELPPNPALITFDDGYLNNFELAWPILKERNLAFSIFLVHDFIEKKILYDGQEQSFMNRDQLLAMQPLAEFGYHSMKHDNLNEVSSLSDEIRTCVEAFKTKNIPIQAFWAYTYGAFPKRDPEKLKKLENVFKENGINGAFRIGNRLNPLPLKKPFQIERIDVRGDESYLKFKIKSIWGKF